MHLHILNMNVQKKYFVSLIKALGMVFDKYVFDIIYIIGDRLEVYAAALSAHFHKIPVAHFAGGQQRQEL